MTADYASTAPLYLTAGWLPFPLPPGQKIWPPNGVTGRAGTPPSAADVYEWCDMYPRGHNIGLRMPDGVIGIDIDHYDDKNGFDTFLACVDKWGDLPETWRSSARGLPSGILFYRVPAGLHWNDLGPGVELIKPVHRYAVVWPSTNPKAGGAPYRWYAPGDYDNPADRIPRVDELPWLPDPWIDELTDNRRLDDEVASAAVDATEADAWLSEHAEDGTCPRVQGTVTKILASFQAGTGHDSLNQLVTLARLAEHGHRGVRTALQAVRGPFLTLATAHGRGHDAQGEFSRSWRGAVGKVLATPELEVPVAPCDCGTDPETLIDRTPPTPGDPTPGATPADAPQVDAYARELEHATRAERLRRDARRNLDAEEAAANFRPPIYVASLADELAIPDEDIRYTIENLMPTGTNVVLAAQFKAGKTTLINHLTRCLADGDPFLGKYNVEKRRVAVWNYEVERNQYRRWWRDVDVQNTTAVVPLNLRGHRMPMISKQVQDWTVDWLQHHEIDLWIVDPYARALVGSADSENNNTEVGYFLDTLDVIKEQAGVSDLVMPAHTGRGEMETGQERVRGATRLDDWADVRWLLTKDAQDVRYFRATGRDVETDEAQLYYRELNRTLSLSGGSREQVRRAGIDHGVLEVIRTTPGMGAAQLRNAVRTHLGSVSNDKVTDAVARLVAEGRVRVDHLGGPKGSQHWPTSSVDDLTDERDEGD